MRAPLDPRQAPPPLSFSSDDELDGFLEAFETCTLPSGWWTHEAHIAVAAAYLSQHPECEATARMIRGIRRFNAAQGSTAYHETLTLFWLALVRCALSLASGTRLADRVNYVVDILGDKKDLVEEYYSPGRLRSLEARLGWIEPDLRVLEC